MCPTAEFKTARLHDHWPHCGLLPPLNWIEGLLDRKWIFIPELNVVPVRIFIYGNSAELWRSTMLGVKQVLFKPWAGKYDYVLGNAQYTHFEWVYDHVITVVFFLLIDVAAATSLQTGCWWGAAAVPPASTQTPQETSLSVTGQLTFSVSFHPTSPFIWCRLRKICETWIVGNQWLYLL